MEEKSSNVNFFVIDKEGNFIYKNEECNKVISHNDAKRLPPKTWEITSSVLKTGKQIIAEEESAEGLHYLSVKSPLIIDGTVEGVIGLAVNITDRKKAEELERQNVIQAKIKELSQQVAHDIQSPLCVLNILLISCKNLSEQEHTTLRSAVTNIQSITSRLLIKNTDNLENIEKLADPIEQYVLVPHALDHIIKAKKYGPKELDIIFNFEKGSEEMSIFVRGDFLNFQRMMFNLIDNAMEAIEGDVGTIDVGFSLKNQEGYDDQFVEIYVKDSGKGMPQETVDKILNDIPVATTKAIGHGIGLQQIKKTVKQMKGRMLIDSKENKGTKISLTFQRSESPSWYVEQVILPKNSLVVVLDDDVSIHDFWGNRLEPYKKDIRVKYFIQGHEVIDFINSSKEKDKIFLLADYELRNQRITGIEVIEKCELQDRSIIVTGCYTSRIENFAKKAETIKFFTKDLINDIQIIVQ
jgi:signal transduction histidine kinase